MDRPIARKFTRGVTWGFDVFVCMHEHARLRHAHPGNFMKLDTEIVSEAILGQKQSCSSYMVREYCIQFLAVHV